MGQVTEGKKYLTLIMPFDLAKRLKQTIRYYKRNKYKKLRKIFIALDKKLGLL